MSPTATAPATSVATPATAAAPMPIWHCDFFQTTGQGAAPLNALTVGSEFGLKCHGDLAIAWTQAPVQVSPAKNENPYSLVILKTVRQDPQDVQYVVTSYVAGQHAPAYVRLVQGDKGFEFDKPAWEVKSVLNPKQPAKPYGPYGPFTLGLPLWFVVAMGLALLLLVVFGFRRGRRYFQRRRMLEELKRHNTALSPLHQFYRDARQLRRRLNQAKSPDELKSITTDLNQEFRLYILRRFQVPALDWSDRAILEDLRRRHRRTHKEAAEGLRKTLRELGQLAIRSQVSDQDVEQIYRMSMDAVEHLDPEPGGRR